MNSSLNTTTRNLDQALFPSKRNYKRGQTIYTQSKSSEGFYQVIKGCVKLQKMLPNGVMTLLKIVTEGEIFGEGNFEMERKNISFAIALEDQTVIQKLEPTANLSQEYQETITQMLIDRAMESVLRHERLVALDAEDRIKTVLKELALKRGVKFGDETLLKINLTHEEIAMLSDSSRQTVTKTFSMLKRNRIINYSRNRILFRDLDNFN